MVPANCIIPQVCSAACVLQLDGNNFAPNAPLRVTIFSDPIDLGVVTADASGEIHATLAVPHLEPGQHDVEVTSLAGNPVNERGSALVGLQTPSYVSQAPVRVLDTRPDGPQVGYSGPKPAAEQTVELTIAGVGGVPVDAVAVALNVTATNANGDGFVTVWPCGTDRPLASNLNHTTNQTIPNLVIVKVGTGGKVCLFTQTGTHLIADVQGWYPAGTAFESQPPTRALDTRPDGPQVGYSGPKPAAEQTVELAVAGLYGVPDDADAVALNVTATEANGNGFVTVWPCGTDRPLASNLNHTANQSIPNLVIVKIGAGGKVCLFTQTGTHLIADVQGWYPAGTAFHSQPPTRALDTRPDGPQVGYSGPKPTAEQTIELPIAGVNGVPDFAGTVALNITATEANGNGFVTVWPCGTDRPLASNLNHTTNQTIPNLVIVKIGAGGKVCLFTQTGTHLIADVQGWSID